MENAGEEQGPLIDPASTKRIRSWSRFYWVATVWLIGYLGIIAKQAVCSGNVLWGIQHGATVGAVTSWFMLILTVPLGLFGSVIASSWRPLRAHKFWVSLVLPIFISFADVISLAIAQIHPHGKFESVTGVKFPADATAIQCSFTGTDFILADPQHVYEFTCSPAETERLTRELKLHRNAPGSYPGRGKGGSWSVSEYWTSDFPTERSVDFIELETDSSRTRVRVIASWI
ncbi:hypothetical protein [Luteolibacter luteus]|uniref:Uncharacterized protein n=1 Tax=Luteolibacter luteus TaxID=2728835 RepID=A0A858RIK5_9BACT|nr:hypothetical protein [Luteolibacter luteus]QJE96672.1 hypothetical protein HHL09_13055 [Luteolibacter luteus]